MPKTRTAYHIRFKLRDGSEIFWTRFHYTMEECLTETKKAIEREYGDEWTNSISICGPQGVGGPYAF